MATLLYAALLLGGARRLDRRRRVSPTSLPARKHLLYSVFVTGVACATVASIGSYLAESLRDAGQKLEEAAEQVADLQELNKVIVRSIHSGLIIADCGRRVLYVNGVGEASWGGARGRCAAGTLREVFGSWLLDAPAPSRRAPPTRTLRASSSPTSVPGGPVGARHLRLARWRPPSPGERGSCWSSRT